MEVAALVPEGALGAGDWFGSWVTASDAKCNAGLLNSEDESSEPDLFGNYAERPSRGFQCKKKMASLPSRVGSLKFKKG